LLYSNKIEFDDDLLGLFCLFLFVIAERGGGVNVSLFVH